MYKLRVILLSMGCLCAGVAHAAVSDGSGTGRFWATYHDNGLAAVTELWTDTEGGGKSIGMLPGRLSGLAQVSDGRLFCQMTPVSSSGYGSSQRLIAPQTWEIRLQEPVFCALVNADSVDMGSVRLIEQTLSSDGPVTAVAQALSEGVNLANMAYTALHRWEFQNAATLYRRAAKQVSNIPHRFGQLGALTAPFDRYADALDETAHDVEKAGARRVCREHLSMIGELLTNFEANHSEIWPDDLKALRTWGGTRTELGLDTDNLYRLFRASGDSDSDRPASYFYRPNAQHGEAVVTSFFYTGRLVELVRTSNGFWVQDREVGQAQADSLLKVGESLLNTDLVQAVWVLEMVTQVFPRWGQGYNQLGYAYLKAGQPDRARASFDRAIQNDQKLAEAYNGLGLVFQDHPKGRYDAIRYFRKALQWQPDYVEARFNMAKLRMALKEYDAKRDLERVIEQDANFTSAHLLLGQWYEEQENYESAALAYAKYLSVKPDDAEGRRRLASVYIQTKDFDRITALLEDYVRQHPNEIEVLPVLAQACIEQRRLEWAHAYFNTYVMHAPTDIKAFYEDIRLLASDEELAEYQMLDAKTRENFLNEFWSLRDPDLSTEPNERKLEHYRRVWYAQTHFSEGHQPWDQRGEVYVRFGEPDYRSRSDMVNMEQSLAVQRVKDRMAQTIYGRSATERSYFGPVYPVRGLKTSLSGLSNFDADVPVQAMQSTMQSREQASRTQMGGQEARSVANSQATAADQTGVSDETLWRIRNMDLMSNESNSSNTEVAIGGRVNGGNSFDLRSSFQGVGVGEDASMVRWESWVYTDIFGGIEITFTDEAMTGNYDYAPPPLEAQLPLRQLALFSRYNPKRVVDLAQRMMPDYDVTPENKAPMPFYFDVVDFRGDQESKSAVEVYTGIPREIGDYVAKENMTQLVVERVVALLDEESGAVYRRTGHVRFQGEGDLRQTAGAFVPDVVRLEAPPGRYRLEVQLKDRFSGRQGRYRQDVVVEDYRSATLKVSDLQLAWKVSDKGSDDKFKKGELHVVPMPTRTYAQGQSIFVYYEIYNLKRDAFGQTKYQVEYTIGPKDSALGGIVSRLVQTLSGDKNQVAVGYEQVGKKEAETAYTELALSDCVPGRHYVKVVVTDLNSGRKEEKEASFVVAK